MKIIAAAIVVAALLVSGTLVYLDGRRVVPISGGFLVENDWTGASRLCEVNWMPLQAVWCFDTADGMAKVEEAMRQAPQECPPGPDRSDCLIRKARERANKN